MLVLPFVCKSGTSLRYSHCALQYSLTTRRKQTQRQKYVGDLVEGEELLPKHKGRGWGWNWNLLARFTYLFVRLYGRPVRQTVADTAVQRIVDVNTVTITALLSCGSEPHDSWRTISNVFTLCDCCHLSCVLPRGLSSTEFHIMIMAYLTIEKRSKHTPSRLYKPVS